MRATPKGGPFEPKVPHSESSILVFYLGVIPKGIRVKQGTQGGGHDEAKRTLVHA
jgi:hypothetical protein